MRKAMLVVLAFCMIGLAGCDVNEIGFPFDKYEGMKEVESTTVLTVEEIRTSLSQMGYPEEAPGFRYINKKTEDGQETLYQDIHIQKSNDQLSAALMFRGKYDGTQEAYYKDGAIYVKMTNGSSTTYNYQVIDNPENELSFSYYKNMFENEYYPSKYAPMTGTVTDLATRLEGIQDAQGNYVIDCYWMNGSNTRIVLNSDYYIMYLYKIQDTYIVDTRFIYQTFEIEFPSYLDDWKVAYEESNHTN